MPIPQIYVPELEDVADIHHISLRKIIRLKGKSSGAVIALRKLINSSNWANRLSLVACDYGWFGVSKIYWGTHNKAIALSS